MHSARISPSAMDMPFTSLCERNMNCEQTVEDKAYMEPCYLIVVKETLGTAPIREEEIHGLVTRDQYGFGTGSDRMTNSHIQAGVRKYWCRPLGESIVDANDSDGVENRQLLGSER
jgi:hypothetical protein